MKGLNADEIASLGDRWLIMKRGLYYRPNAMGYTGIREHAGIYTEQEARQRMDVAAGVSIVRFADGPEVTTACFADIASDYWQARATTAEAELSRVKEALKPFAGYLDSMFADLDFHGNPLPSDQGMGRVYLTIGDFRRARLALSPVKDVQATEGGGK